VGPLKNLDNGIQQQGSSGTGDIDNVRKTFSLWKELAGFCGKVSE
jgi:hypothetical protein